MQTGNPQIEDGYLRIANELHVALCRVHLNSNCWRVLNAVIRKTYGYAKKEDAISLSQFEELTGLPKSSVCRAIRQLVGQKVIYKHPGATNVYGVNKKYADWQKCHSDDIATVAELTTPSDDTANKPVTKSSHTKDSKDNNTKDKDMSAAPTFVPKKGKGDEIVTVAIPSMVVGEVQHMTMKCSELEAEYRKFIEGVSMILGKQKQFTDKGFTKYKKRRAVYTRDRLCAAFENLMNEPDRWKIENNAFRPMDWWLRSDDYIVELEHVHQKQVRGSRPHAVII